MKISRKHLIFDQLISVIVVVRNDADIIEKILRKLNNKLKDQGFNYEIIIVDSNSSDQTKVKIKKLQNEINNIRGIVLSKNYQKEITLTAGLDSCIGDYVLIINLYTDPPEVITTMLKYLHQGYDVVIGKTLGNILNRGFLANLITGLVENISSHEFKYNTNYTFGMNRKAVNSMIRTRRKNRNFSYLNYLIGFKKIIFEYQALHGLEHKIEKESVIHIFANTVDIVISNSFKPIRFITITGMVASSSFILYVFSIVILVVVFKVPNIAPQGWISLATVLGTLFFLLFSLLTIISEYIIRILEETRDEPLYFISEEIDAPEVLGKRERLNIV